MKHPYVEKRGEAYRIADSRVSLDSIIFAFRDGLSPETIAAECFPTLKLEQVYGAITYYLSHRAEMDAYLAKGDSEFQTLRETARREYPEFHAELHRVRRKSQMSAV